MADIRQRYADLDSNTTDVIRHSETGSGTLAGTIVVFSGICNSSGTEIALATSTLQTTGNGILTTIDADTGNIATSAASIDTKTPALGQALAAASVPVVLTAAQLTTLTPPAAITGFATEATLSSLNGKVTAVNTGAVVVSSSALPSGASTLAEQQTQTTHLTTIIGHVDGVESALTNTNTFLDVIDDWDETNRCKVNIIVGQAGITAGAGAVAANTPRMTLASDDPAVALLTTIDADMAFLSLINSSLTTIDNNISTIAGAVAGAEVQVDVVAALPAGTNNIGDVDVLTVPADPFGANADAASATGSISAKLRFIASTGIPITGTVTVGSHAVTNAGTFVVQIDGTALTRLTDIETNTDSCAVVGNGAAATAQRVTIANDSTGILAGVTTVTTVTTCSTVTTLTGGGVASGSADSGNPIKVGTRAIAALSTATMESADDRLNMLSDLDGALLTRPQFPLGDLISERVSNTDGASTAFSNFGATASTRNVVTSIVCWNSSATAGYIDFRDGTAGSILFTVPIPATGGVVLPAGSTPYFKTTANTALAFDVSAAISTVYISVSGFKSKVT